MPDTSSIITTWQPVQAWVKPVVAEVATRYGPLYYVWGKSSGTSGEHPLGRALDFSILDRGSGPQNTWVSRPGPARIALGDAIAAYLEVNHRRLNVWYIIWNRRMRSWNPSSYAYGRWTTYRGSNPHTDHVHASFYDDRVYVPPPAPKPPQEDDVTPEDRTAIANLVLDGVGKRVWEYKLLHPLTNQRGSTAETWTTRGRLNVDATKGLVQDVLTRLVAYVGDEATDDATKAELLTAISAKLDELTAEPTDPDPTT